jgi:glycosyltransferase involved in cell wall biosynthesis
LSGSKLGKISKLDVSFEKNRSFMTPISAVVITLNQANKIARCLASLRSVTDDIVVVDSGSTDATAEICRQLGVVFLERAWTGYSDQKNFGNAHAQHDWIISIDDDEYLSEELAGSIRAVFDHSPDFDALELPFRTVFCGKLIRFGNMNPERHVRIFNKKYIQWNIEGVHERLSVKDEHRIRRLAGYVFHHTVDRPEQFAQKTERYARLFAEKAQRAGQSAAWWKQWLSPLVRFVREYFFRLGILDGYWGWFIAKENARYTFLKYRTLWKMSRS